MNKINSFQLYKLDESLKYEKKTYTNLTFVKRTNLFANLSQTGQILTTLRAGAKLWKPLIITTQLQLNVLTSSTSVSRVEVKKDK